MQTPTYSNDTRQFRKCLSKYATGIAVVTCHDNNGLPHGRTINSFSSVSLEPPLVLWSLSKKAHSLNAFLEARFFAINVLSTRQRNLSEHFASSNDKNFNNIDYIKSSSNPLITMKLYSNSITNSFNSRSSICVRIALHSFGKITTDFTDNIKF